MLAIRFWKKWVGLAQPSNTAILFLPNKRGGLALPSLVSLYKKQQSSCMVQLFTSDDPGVHRAAHLLLQEEERAQRTRFKPAVFVNEIRAVDSSKSRQALAKTVKSLLEEEDAEQRHDYLCSLPFQGEMTRCWEGNSPQMWVGAVELLPPEILHQCCSL